MRRPFFTICIAAALVGAASCAPQSGTPPAPGAGVPMTRAQQIARGDYLTTVMGCGHCHTPGGAYGSPDQTRRYAGQEVGWYGTWGVTYGRNLTPDAETGIGKWTEADIVKVFQTGTRPDSTAVLHPMPWPWLASLTKEDAAAIAAFLKSLPPIVHKVPDKIPADKKPTGPVITFPIPPDWDVPVVPEVPAS
jgi:mono/diheme cytochrome c family protein